MGHRVGLFVDISNLYYCVGKRFERKIDYEKYLELAVGSGILVRAFAYGSHMEREADSFLFRLRQLGYEPKYKRPKEFENPDYWIDVSPIEQIIDLVGRQKFDPVLLDRVNKTLSSIKGVLKAKKDIRKANWDVGIAIDVVRMINRLDTIVIGSADGDFAALVEWIKEQGCRCNIIACEISSDLKGVADSCIEIDESLLEVRRKKSEQSNSISQVEKG